jgi:hypothetical protein
VITAVWEFWRAFLSAAWSFICLLNALRERGTGEQ